MSNKKRGKMGGINLRTEPVSTIAIDDQKKIAAENFINSAKTETDKDVAVNSKATVLDIPLKTLVASSFNARAIYRDSEIDSIALSLADKGQLVPAIVVAHGTGYMVVDGHYRLKGAEKLKWATLRCEVRTMNLSDYELFEASHTVNEERKSQTLIDSAITWKSMVDSSVATPEKLSQSFNRSKGEVSKILRLGGLPRSFLEMLSQKETEIGVHAGYSISQLFTELSDDLDKFTFLVEKIIKHDLNRSAIEKLRTDLLKEQKKPKPKSTPYHQFTDAKGKVKGTLDVRGKKVSMNFEAHSAEAAKKITDVIAHILEESANEQG